MDEEKTGWDDTVWGVRWVSGFRVFEKHEDAVELQKQLADPDLNGTPYRFISYITPYPMSYLAEMGWTR